MRHGRWGIGMLSVVLLLGLGVTARWAAGQAGGSSQPSRPPEDAPLKGGVPFTTEPPVPNQAEPQISVDSSGRVFRLWTQEREGRREAVVRFTRSEDGGLSWPKEPLTLPDNGDKGQAIGPRMRLDGRGNVFAVWRTKFRSPNARLIRFQRSPDFGNTWEPASRDLNREVAGFEPEIALGPDGHLYVAWSDERRGSRQFDVFFTRSRDAGKTWEGETRITGEALGTRLNFRPRLLSDATGRVYLTWIGIGSAGSTVFFRRSGDFGATWDAPVNAGIGGSSTTSQTLLQGLGEQLFLTWHAVRTGLLSVYFSRSEDGGKTWLAAPTEVSHQPTGKETQSAFPGAARGPKGELYVVWQDTRNGREDIYLNRSLDDGKSWLAADIRLDQDAPGTAISRLPEIAVSDKGTLAVAWSDDRKGFAGIYLAVSHDGGKSWRETRMDENTPARADAKGVRMAWGQGEVLHLVWEIHERHSVSDVETSVQYRRLAVAPPSGS